MEYGDNGNLEAQDGVILQIFGDDGHVMRRLDAIESRGKTIARDLSRDFSQVKTPMLHLAVTVDDRRLTHLNKHAELKRTHFKDLQRWFDANPLTVRFNQRALDEGVRDVRSQLGRSVEIKTKVAATVETSLLTAQTKHLDSTISKIGDGVKVKNIDDLPDRIAKAIEKAQKPSLLGRVAGIATAPIRAVSGFAGNVFTGVGLEVGFNLARGLGTSKVARQAGQSIKKTADTVDRYFLDIQESSAAFLAEFFRSGDIGKSAQAGFNVTPANKALKQLGLMQKVGSQLNKDNYVDFVNADPELKQIAQKLAEVDADFSDLIKGKTTSFTRVFNKLLDAVKPSEAIEGLIKPALQAASKPLSYIANIQTYRNIYEGKQLALAYQASMPKLGQGQSGYLIGMPGAMYRKGQGGGILANQYEGLFPERRLTTVSNPDTDPGGVPQNALSRFLYNKISAAAPDIFGDGMMNNTLVNGLTMAVNALNPASFSRSTAEAVGQALEAKRQGVDASVFSYSLGGSSAKSTAMALQKMGVGDVPVFAMAYPDMNIVDPKLSNFKAGVTHQDPLGFPDVLGLTGRYSQTYIGNIQASDKHAPYSYIGGRDFLEDFSGFLGLRSPLNDSKKSVKQQAAYSVRMGALFEKLGASVQANSLMKSGDFDLSAPFKGFTASDRPIATAPQVFKDATELFTTFSGITDKDISELTPEQQQITKGIQEYAQNTYKDLLEFLKKQGFSINSKSKPEEVQMLLEILNHAPKIQSAKQAFSTGEAGENNTWVPKLDKQSVSRRMGELETTVKYFSGFSKSAPIYGKQIAETFKSLQKAMQEFIDTGRVSPQTLSDIPDLNEFQNILSLDLFKKQLDTYSLPSQSEASFKNEATIPAWAKQFANTKQFDKAQRSVTAYNLMSQNMGEIQQHIPNPESIERFAMGMSGAVAFLTNDHVYKADFDPQKLASRQEMAAYEKLQGRRSPQMFAASEGKYLVTERLKGTPLKDILESAASPYRQRNKDIESLKKIQAELKGIEKRTEAEDQELERISKQLDVLRKKRENSKKIFNSRIEPYYRKLGELGGYLQSLGVAHMDLASSNVFFQGMEPSAIDLGNSIADPTKSQKQQDRNIAVQRMLIDQDYYGLMNIPQQAQAISKGWRKPQLAEVAPRPATIAQLPIYSGNKSISEGVSPTTLIQGIIGDYTQSPKVQETIKLRSSLPEVSQPEIVAETEQQVKKTSSAIVKLGEAATESSNALVKLGNRMFPVAQQGGGAILRQGLNDVYRYGVRPAVQAVGTGIKTLDTATNFLPLGKEVKIVAKEIALPAAAITFLSNTPVASQALEAVGQMGAHAMNFAPHMLAENMPAWVYGGVNKLLEFSGAGGVAGATASAGAALGKYGAYQYLARQGKSLIDVSYEKLTESPSLTANPEQKQLPHSQQRFAGSTPLALPPIGDPTVLAKLTQEVRKAYKEISAPNLGKQSTETLIRNIEKYLFVLNKARAEAARIPNELVGKSDKAQLSRSRSDAEKGAIAELAKRIGQDTESGLEQGIDLSEIRKLGSEVGLTLTDEVKKVLGIASPSKVFIKIGEDIVAGFEIGIGDLGNIEGTIQGLFQIANKSGKKIDPLAFGGIDKIAKDIIEGTEGGTRDFQKNFVTLEQQGSRTAQGVKQQYQELKDLGKAALQDVVPERQIDRTFRRGAGFVKEIDPLNSALRELSNIGTAIDERFPRVNKILKSVGSSLLLGLGVFTIGDALVRVGQQGFQSAIELERTKIALDFTNAGKGREVLNEIRTQANDLGTSFIAAAESRKRLDNAAFGGTLQLATPALASLQQEILAPRALSSDEQKRFGITTAQVIAKGNFQREEALQYAEAGLPIESSLAKALGLSPHMLSKRLQSGEVSAEKAIPLLFSQLASESKAKQDDLKDSAPAQLNRLANESQRSLVAFGEGASVVALPAIKGLTGALSLFNNNLDKAAFAVTTLGTAMTISMVGPALGGIAEGLLRVASVGAFAAKELAKTVLLPTAVAGGLAALGFGAYAYYDKAIKGSSELIESNDRLLASIQRVNAEYSKTPQVPTPAQSPKSSDPLLRARDDAGMTARAIGLIMANPLVKTLQNPQELIQRIQKENAELGNLAGRDEFEKNTGLLDQGGGIGYQAIAQYRRTQATPEFNADVKRRVELQTRIDALKSKAEIASRNYDLEGYAAITKEIGQLTENSLKGGKSGLAQAELSGQKEELSKSLSAAEADLKNQNLGGADRAARESQIDSFKKQITAIDQELEMLDKRLRVLPNNLEVKLDVQMVGLQALESAEQLATGKFEARSAQLELGLRKDPNADNQTIDYVTQRNRLDFTSKKIAIQQAEIAKAAKGFRETVAQLEPSKRGSVDEFVNELEAGSNLETASGAALQKVLDTFQLDTDQKAAIQAQLQVKELGKTYTALSAEQAKTGIELEKLLRDRKIQMLDRQKLLNDIPLIQAERYLNSLKAENEIAQQMSGARSGVTDSGLSLTQAQREATRGRGDFALEGIDQRQQLTDLIGQNATPLTASSNRLIGLGFERQKLAQRGEGLDSDRSALASIQEQQKEQLDNRVKQLTLTQEQTKADLEGQKIAAERAANDALLAVKKAEIAGASGAEINNLKEQYQSALAAQQVIDRRIAAQEGINRLQLESLDNERKTLGVQQSQEQLAQKREERAIAAQQRIIEERTRQEGFNQRSAELSGYGGLVDAYGSLQSSQIELQRTRNQNLGGSSAQDLQLQKRQLDIQQRTQKQQLDIQNQQLANDADRNVEAAKLQQKSALEALSEGQKAGLSRERLSLLQDQVNLANNAVAAAEREAANARQLIGYKRSQLAVEQEIAQEKLKTQGGTPGMSLDATGYGQNIQAQQQIGSILTPGRSIDRSLIEQLTATFGTSSNPFVGQQIASVGIDQAIIGQLSRIDQFQRSSILNQAQGLADSSGVNFAQALSRLSDQIRAIAMRPSVLNVSSPTPVADAAGIYRDLSR